MGRKEEDLLRHASGYGLDSLLRLPVRLAGQGLPQSILDEAAARGGGGGDAAAAEPAEPPAAPQEGAYCWRARAVV